MTFVVDANTDAEQVVKQVDKLIEVVSIRDISDENMIIREMAMVKLRTDRSDRTGVIELVDVFGAEIVDVARDSMIVEITGDEDKIESFISLLGDYEIIELLRTGRVAMLRGSAVSHPPHHEEEPERYQGFEPPYSAK
jgi:acetolactate synthase-1/3 small subunit